MFASPIINLLIQGNIQAAANANVLSLGGPQSNTQTASNEATVTNTGSIGGGGGGS